MIGDRFLLEMGNFCGAGMSLKNCGVLHNFVICKSRRSRFIIVSGDVDVDVAVIASSRLLSAIADAFVMKFKRRRICIFPELNLVI